MSNRVVIIRNAAPSDFGGGERFPVLLASILEENGYRAVVLSGSSKLLAFASSSKVKHYRSWWWQRQGWDGKNALLLPIYILWQILLYFHYLVWFIRLRPSVVHIQSKDDFISATLAGRSLGKKIIWTDHADLKHVFKNIDKPWRNPTGKLVALCGHQASNITVVSKSEKKLVSKNLARHRYLIDKLMVIYNGALDNKTKMQVSKKSKIYTFLYLGRLVHDKGIGELVEAFGQLHTEWPDTQLLVVGDGPDRSVFESSSQGKPIIFHGHQDNPQHFFAEADAFVYPTYHEGFSLSLVEATMASLPIITTNVGGNPEIIQDHKTGLLIPAKDTDALYRAMLYLMEHQDIAKDLGRQARLAYESNFQFDKIVEEDFIPLYEKTTTIN